MTSAEELSRRRRIGVLLICSMSLFIVGLDVTAVNVALPAIRDQLDASLSWLQWSVSAYTVVMASLLLLSGSMADRLGRKKTLLMGLSVFSLASLLCSLAPTVELLVAFRVLQGIGAAMLNPVAMSISPTHSLTRASAHRRSGSGAPSSGRPWRWVRSSAARSSLPSAGSGSS